MYHFSGKCECKGVSLTLSLPHKLENYSPRTCDCDFCVAYSASYLSDANGKLCINAETKLRRAFQGSNQAEFLICTECNTLVAVTVVSNSLLKGAVNSCLLDSKEALLNSQNVSPKTFSAADKLNRWERLWLLVNLNEKRET